MNNKPPHLHLKYILHGIEHLYVELEDLYPLILFGYSPKHHAWQIDVIVPSGELLLKSHAQINPVELDHSLSQVVVQKTVEQLVQSIRQKINASNKE